MSIVSICTLGTKNAIVLFVIALKADMCDKKEHKRPNRKIQPFRFGLTTTDPMENPEMAISEHSTALPPAHQPIVFERDSRVFANSRDVAMFFEKNHRDVTRAIENLIAQKPELGVRNFAQTPYVEEQNGQTYKTYDMDRKGFVLLTIGFTGQKALDFKIAYIDQFDAMESALKNRAVGFAIPQTLSEALRLAADQADTIERQKTQIAQQASTVVAFNRIAKSDGSLCITDAAKDLQVRPKDLFSFLRQQGWIYSRLGKAGDIAYQDKIQAGYLEHKVTTVTRTDGSEKTVEQVRVTAKGLAKLAKLLGDGGGTPVMPPPKLNGYGRGAHSHAAG